MFKTLKEVLRVGNATCEYPAAPLERPPFVRGKPEHSLDACLACSACANACPPNAIQMLVEPEEDTISWSINYGRCIFCGRCEEVCPTKAIVLTDEFELAVFDRQDLEQVCAYPLQRCSECGQPFASAKEVAYVKSLLAQEGQSLNVSLSAEHVEKCPECRQRIDAQRARFAIDETGNPTEAPSAEAMEESKRIALERRRAAGNDI